MCVTQIQSGLGKLILKEEKEKEQSRERHSRSVSAQRYDPKPSNCEAGKHPSPSDRTRDPISDQTSDRTRDCSSDQTRDQTSD